MVCLRCNKVAQLPQVFMELLHMDWQSKMDIHMDSSIICEGRPMARPSIPHSKKSEGPSPAFLMTEETNYLQINPSDSK